MRASNAVLTPVTQVDPETHRALALGVRQRGSQSVPSILGGPPSTRRTVVQRWTRGCL